MNLPDRFKKRLFLWMPFLMLAIAFIVDKQIPLWGLQDYFLRTASFLSYEHKDRMLAELEAYSKRPDRKKILIVFGNSRTTTFDNRYIDQKYPGWILFNFSVPGGTSDYYLYRMQQFAERGIQPDFVLFAVSPEGINGTPAVAMDEVLLEGLPTSFILRNFYNYRVEHLTNFIAKRTFWGYQYRPKVGTIVRRMKNDGRELKDFRTLLQTQPAQFDRARGSVPMHAGKSTVDDARLKVYAAAAFRDFLTPFKPSSGQLDFTERMLQLAREQKIPGALIWVKVGPHLRALQNQKRVVETSNGKITITEYFLKEMNALAARYDSQLLDMNSGQAPGIACEDFYDSSHMAAYCFGPLTDYIFAAIEPAP